MRIIILSLLVTLLSGQMIDHNVILSVEESEQTQKPLLTFGLIADVQYCNCEPAGTRYYRESLSKLRKALGTLSSDSVGFVVTLGDLIDRDFESYQPVMSIIDSSGLEFYHALGNHDFSVEQRYKRRLPQNTISKDGYYSFIKSDIRLIMLNGNELSTYGAGNNSTLREAQAYIETLKSQGKKNAMDWNGGISVKQLEWFIKELDKAKSAGQKVIVFSHFPVYPENPHNLLNSTEVLSVLGNAQGVIAYFAGHNHAGNYGNFNTIHFVNMKGMVETPSSGAFSIIEVYSNKIWIRGENGEKSQILAY